MFTLSFTIDGLDEDDIDYRMHCIIAQCVR